MYLCYLDESGVPEIGQGTSHYVLLGFAIQVWDWKNQDGTVTAIKRKFGLENVEIHTGWMTRRYLEQERIQNFEQLDTAARRGAVQQERAATLQRTAAVKGPAKLTEVRKNFRKTEPYTHLTRAERLSCLRDLADLLGSWGHSRVFAECIDKTSFGQTVPTFPPREEAFRQVVTRFEQMLLHQPNPQTIGLLIHDNDETNAVRLTELMRHFHSSGTFFADITRIVETPFFVDSRLTVGVQLADLCAYATRRFFENSEADLFDRIYSRFDRMRGGVVGIRHYTGQRTCDCKVCVDRRGGQMQMKYQSPTTA